MNRSGIHAGAAFFSLSIFTALTFAMFLVVACATTSTAKPAIESGSAHSESQSGVTPADLAATKAKLNATFKRFQFDEIRASEIPGVVEIYAGGQILYYAPKEDILILGELYAANGTSITQQKMAQRAARQADSIDKTAALVVGEGTTDLIEFVDPDCPHCRAAEDWLGQQDLKGIRQLVYFMPTTDRASATSRALHALCAPPEGRRAALHQVFDRTHSDAEGSAPPCSDGAARLARQGEIGRQLGVNATPFFIVKGQVVAGFDRERLSALLKPQTQKEGEKR